MKDLLNFLFENNVLSSSEAKETLHAIAGGKYSPLHVSSFLTVFRMRNITVDELRGFRDAMIELCIPVDLSDYTTVDLCGTGGDNKNTFNISTLASFVTAGAGVHVAKHGNYGVSSVSGSSNVLEHLGVKFSNDMDKIRKSIEVAGICFLHAPLFHPAMKFVAPIRKELGFKTFFNMLGPMVNPSSPKNQVVGVFNLELARLYNYLYQKTDKNYCIVHSLDGYDEISLTGPYKIISSRSEEIILPEKYGFKTHAQEDLHGGDSIKDAAEIFMNVLNGKGSRAQEDVVVMNASMAIHCVKTTLSHQECIELARESLRSGRALQSFRKLTEIN